MTPTLVPTPPITTGVASTVNALVGGVHSFFTGAWPVIVALVLLMCLALVAFGFATRATTRLIHYSGTESDIARLRGAHLARREHNRRHGFDD